jgi:DNA-binding NtrC family response regulator
MLSRYAWPGNVRELENTIERAVVLSTDEHFTEELLPLTIRTFAEQGRPSVRPDSPEELMKRLVVEAMEEDHLDLETQSIWERLSTSMERIMIEEALKRCDGVKLKAADYLGINRNTLNKKYQDFGLGAGHAGPDRSL